MTSTHAISIPDTTPISTPTTTTPESDLDLSHLPPIYLLPTRLSDVTLHSLEQSLLAAGAPLTYNPNEAGIVVGDVNTMRRAEMELRGRGVWCRSVGEEEQGKGDGVSGASGGVDGGVDGEGGKDNVGDKDKVKVVKIRWVTEMLEKGEMLDVEKWVVYAGRKVEKPKVDWENGKHEVEEEGEEGGVRKKVRKGFDSIGDRKATKSPGNGILERAKLDAVEHGPSSSPLPYHHNRFSHHHHRSHGSTTTHPRRTTPTRPPPTLLPRQSTFEYELTSQRPIPSWVKQNLKYSCQRSTPLNPPNAHFISLLQTIKLQRTLSLDQIGIRAYSTAIASIAAYPYPLLSSAELSTLPGCDGKTASLFHEYIHSTPTAPVAEDTQRTVKIVEELEGSEEFTTLRLFWGIWGVGAHTAREFYFGKGWRSLDDVVEFGWDSLSRVQQIGVKFYDEFNNCKISRTEVERIADIILAAVRKVGGKDWDGLVCGGYRRGKEWSGDVDIVLSHPDEELFDGHPGGKGGAAVDWVGRIVVELESQGRVTHTLYLGRGGGFGSQRVHPVATTTTTTSSLHHTTTHDTDTLAKAMLVWQDPFPPGPGAEAPPPPPSNTDPHRRVDIILAPPSCAGTAILGWTGATTYERDLRRFVEKQYGWKFDSGGVWDRTTGGRVPGLGDWRGKEGEGLVEAEKRLLRGLGIEWRVPWERNTG